MSYYKIFFSPKFIYLADNPDGIHEPQAEIIEIENKEKQKEKIDRLVNEPVNKTQILYSADLTRLFENFKKSFHWIEAAGGIVFNRNEEILLIHRRGFWDLPKGKIDAGESPEQAAIREVQEETALINLKILRKIKLFRDFQEGTLHVYPLKKGLALKLTHWFVMQTTDEHLQPQTEEDIDEAKWVKRDDLKNYFSEMYVNLVELFEFV